MFVSFRVGLVAAGLFLTSQTCLAEPLLSLSSSSADLSNLMPGQVATIQVELTGLGPGDQLDFLAATLVFDADLLGTPSVTPGPIIPDATGFVQGESPGLADGLYDTLFAVSGDPDRSGRHLLFLRRHASASRLGHDCIRLRRLQRHRRHRVPPLRRDCWPSVDLILRP